VYDAEKNENICVLIVKKSFMLIQRFVRFATKNPQISRHVNPVQRDRFCNEL
jgi:hypothetical protein